MDSYDPAAIADAFPGGRWAAAPCGPNGGNCVEVNLGISGLAGVRDSKSDDSVLVFDREKWVAFLGAAKSDRLDRARPR